MVLRVALDRFLEIVFVEEDGGAVVGAGAGAGDDVEHLARQVDGFDADHDRAVELGVAGLGDVQAVVAVNVVEGEVAGAVGLGCGNGFAVAGEGDGDVGEGLALGGDEEAMEAPEVDRALGFDFGTREWGQREPEDHCCGEREEFRDVISASHLVLHSARNQH